MIAVILTFFVNACILYTLGMLIQILFGLWDLPFFTFCLQHYFHSSSLWKQMSQNAILIAASLLLLSCLASRTTFMQYFLRRLYRCRTLKEEERELEYIFSALCEKAGVERRAYRFYLCEEAGWNAFAMGNNQIAITTGLVTHYTSSEIMGILAHELGHIIHRDTIYSTMCLAMEWMGQLVIRLYSLLAIGLQFFRIIPLVNIITLLLSFFLVIQIYFFKIGMQLPLWITERFLSRRREYAADHYAYTIGCGGMLKEGLEKFSLYEQKLPFWRRWFSTHPDTKKRIKRIEQYLKYEND